MPVLENPWQKRWMLLVTLPLALIILFWRFRFGSAFLAFYDDDFFYYLRVATELANHHISSFDGVHLTNGYHPLWLLVLTALAKIFSGKSFFIALQSLILLSFAVTWEAGRAVLQSMEVSNRQAQAMTSIAACASLLLMMGGMEVVLVIPAALCVAGYRMRGGFTWSMRQGAVYGLLIAVMILSRLDSVLLALLLGAIEIGQILLKRAHSVERSVFVGLAASALAAFVPIAIYVAINLHFFHVATPISGEAKQLRHHHWPTAIVLKMWTHDFPAAKRFGLIFPAALTAFAGAWRLRDSEVRRRVQPPGQAMLFFPIAQGLSLSILSDWAIWGWYLYPFVLCFIAGSGILLLPASGKKPAWIKDRTLTLVALFYTCALTGYVVLQSPSRNVLFLIARDIVAFEATHPGTYAMGDSAGTAGYLMHSQMIQLEGLVMDKSYLENIRQQRNLNAVLHDYGVRYYIATIPAVDQACYSQKEPQQAGPDSPAMKGVFCGKPVAKFTEQGAAVGIFDLESVPQS